MALARALSSRRFRLRVLRYAKAAQINRREDVQPTHANIYFAAILLLGTTLIFATDLRAAHRGTGPACVSGVAFHGTLIVSSKAGQGGTKLGELAPNSCGLSVESVEGNWSFIRGTDRSGQNIEGWVNNNFLRAAAGGVSSGVPQVTQASFPIRAASGGGVVRSGPGTQYRKRASVGQFEPVTVIRNTGKMMNGYPWFEIRYRGGKKGYQWGGIICSTDQPFTGTFDTCDNFRNSLQRNTGNTTGGGTTNTQQTQNRRVEYSCNEGIPMIVTFVETPTESYALYSHDSGPTNRVAIAVSGSGFRYTNGYHELLGKGTTLDLIEGGDLIDRCHAQ